MARPVYRAGSLPVAQLPAGARAFADLPYAPVTEVNRQFHLRTYERWCAQRQLTPWPVTLVRLMEYAADRAPGRSYYTIREHVRIVSMVERRHSGVDLFARCELQQLLDGIRRECPPRPVLPLRPSQVDRLLSYRPSTNSQRQTRTAILLTYAVGFGQTEHDRLRCEMVEFDAGGATVSGLGSDRPVIYIGPARDADRCPVRGLRELIGERKDGPLYRTARGQREDGKFSNGGLASEIKRYGRAAGVTPLSTSRIRLAGLVEQARHIDIVRLAHFHGYRSVETLARLLGRYIEVNAGLRFMGSRP